jgi:hypothetical protein
MIAGRAATVVVFARARGFGEHRERPPVTRVAEAFVADLAGLDVARSTRRDRHRRGAGERAQTVRIGESCGVIADLAEHTGGEDRSETGDRTQDSRLGVGVELVSQRGLELVDNCCWATTIPISPPTVLP